MADALPPELSGLLETAEAGAREAAWSAFLKAHGRLLLHTARSLGHDYDAAMDAYAFLLEQLRKDDFHRLRAYSVDGRSKFSTWLVVIARRLCLDFHRQRYGRARDTEPSAAESRRARRRLVDLMAEEIDLATIADSAATSPEGEAEAREQSARLGEALARLGPRDRLLLQLRFEYDLSAREIGEILRFPTPFHVYRRLNALFAELRAWLGGGDARRGER